MSAVVYHIRKKGETNIADGYIGVTVDLKSREYYHFSKMEDQRHPNQNLNESFRDHNLEMVVLLEAEEDCCYEVERKLRPKWNMGWNIAIGGGKSPFSLETEEQTLARARKGANTRKAMGINCSQIRSDRGTHNWLKDRRGSRPLGNEFSSDSARELALKRGKGGALPGQVRAASGTHHWQTPAHSERIKETNKRFRDTVTVTNKNGISMRITKSEFEAQKIGKRADWEFVGAASAEAKVRRGNKQ